MSELRADTLSPIDAATLWPQLHRLGTEIIATRGTESLLVASGLAATGITRLPKVPRTVVVGLKRGLSYRGVLTARELSGGAGWEVVSVRLRRDMDDEAVIALLQSVSHEVAQRGGRTLYLRYAEGSPHAAALRKGGFFSYRLERLFAVPPTDKSMETTFRTATSTDRHGVFRLYCRAVPEIVRRVEAPTQQEWRAVLDSYDCNKEFVLDSGASLGAWVGVGERESHVLIDDGGDGVVDSALDLVETQSGRHATLVVAEHQGSIERVAGERGYTPLGVRLMCARRLAVLNTLKEVVAVAAENFALPQ